MLLPPPVDTLAVHEARHTLDELLLAPRVREAIKQVLLEHAHAAALTAAGCTPAVKLLFDGPPGTGKTSCAGAIARALEVPLYVAKQHAVVASHMGESDRNVAKTFEYARAARGVFLLDEFDSYAFTRMGEGTAEGSARVAFNQMVTTLLAMLDQHVGPGLIIAATNRLDAIDPAARRRFDAEVTFDLPDDATRKELIRRTLGDTTDVAIDVPTRTKGSHADIVRACLVEKKRRILAEIIATDAAPTAPPPATDKPRRTRSTARTPEATVTRVCSHEVGFQPVTCACDADCYCRDALCARSPQRELGIG